MTIAIPNLIFLLGYLVFLGIFAFYAYFNLRQLREYGTNDAKTRLASLIFLGASGLIMIISASVLLGIDWGANLQFELGAPVVGL